MGRPKKQKRASKPAKPDTEDPKLPKPDTQDSKPPKPDTQDWETIHYSKQTDEEHSIVSKPSQDEIHTAIPITTDQTNLLENDQHLQDMLANKNGRIEYQDEYQKMEIVKNEDCERGSSVRSYEVVVTCVQPQADELLRKLDARPAQASQHDARPAQELFTIDQLPVFGKSTEKEWKTLRETALKESAERKTVLLREKERMSWEPERVEIKAPVLREEVVLNRQWSGYEGKLLEDTVDTCKRKEVLMKEKLVDIKSMVENVKSKCQLSEEHAKGVVRNKVADYQRSNSTPTFVNRSLRNSFFINNQDASTEESKENGTATKYRTTLSFPISR